MGKLKEGKTKLATTLRKGDVVLTPDGYHKALEVKVEKLFVSVYVIGTAPGQKRAVYDYHKKEQVYVKVNKHITKPDGPKAKNAAARAAELRKKIAGGGRKAKTQFTSWSYSRYADYKLCPLKAKLKHLDGIKEPQSAPMERGSAIGELAELYIKGKIRWKETGGALDRFRKLFDELRAQAKRYPRTIEAEETWAFTRDGKVTAWNDWDGCFLRVKVDVGRHESKTRMVVIDWKTGRYDEGRREEYVEQLELYALGAFMRHPTMGEVEVKLAYLDAGVMYPDDFGEKMVFARADMPRLKKTWDKRTRALLLDKAFAPRPNEKCRWCFFRKENAAAMPSGKAMCKY